MDHNEIEAKLIELKDGRAAFVKEREIRLNSEVASYDGWIAALEFALGAAAREPEPTKEPPKP